MISRSNPVCTILLVALFGAYASAQSGSVVSVKGRVLTESGKGVEGAEIYLYPLDEPPPARQVTVTTNQSGDYEVQVHPGKYAIHAFKSDAGYPDSVFAFSLAPNQEIPKVTVRPGEDLTGVDVKLGPRPGILHLNVVDKNTGRTLEVAEYKLCQALRPSYCMDSSAPGEYDFTVPPTKISLVVSARGYSKTVYGEDGDQTISIGPGQERKIVIKLTRE